MTPRSIHHAQRIRSCVALATTAIAVLMGAATAAPAQIASFARLPIRTGVTPDTERAFDTLRDAAAAPAARTDAARELCRCEAPEARTRVLALLARDADAEIRRLVLTAAAEHPSTDPWMVPALVTLLTVPPTTPTTPPNPAAPGAAVDDADQTRAIAALGAVRARDSAQALVRALCAAESPERRDAACAALVRCTGRNGFGADCRAWNDWLARAMTAPDLDWMREQSVAQADRADALARQLTATTARIVDVLRKSYIDAPSAEDRCKLLIAWLADDLPEVRRLSFELINRELANARQIDPRVALATLKLVADPMPDLRARGADLAFSLGPEGAGDAVAKALLTETDPLVAAALLRAATRWPSTMTADVVLEWSEADPDAGARGSPTAIRTARRAALDASAALAGVDKLTPAGASRVLSVLRRMPDAELGGAGCALLTRLGSDEDRTRVVEMLQSPVLKPAAADGLAADARGVPVLIGAAANDASLFPIAARAVTRWSPSSISFARLAALPAPTPEALRDGLLQLAAALDSDDLLAAARSSSDPTLREALLSRLAAAPGSRRPWTAGATGADPAHAAGLLLLAQTRLDLGQPSGAIAALEALSSVPNSVDPAVRASMLTIALLWLNRIDEAASAGSGPEAWLDGLRRAASQPHARDIAAAIRTRFGATLTSEQTARLNDIESKLARPH